MIEFIAKPREVVSWIEFCSTHPRFSIALDGYVPEGPIYQPPEKGGPRRNFNHHEGVDRLATRSTCAQVYVAIKMGLFECFRERGFPHASVYFNDCD